MVVSSTSQAGEVLVPVSSQWIHGFVVLALVCLATGAQANECGDMAKRIAGVSNLKIEEQDPTHFLIGTGLTFSCPEMGNNLMIVSEPGPPTDWYQIAGREVSVLTGIRPSFLSYKISQCVDEALRSQNQHANIQISDPFSISCETHQDDKDEMRVRVELLAMTH
jgi:hypothetical protein